jgi:ABC-2 type transport system ATP-binding protein
MLSIRDLTKHFGVQTAVDRLTLAAPAGQIIGLVGPNGAGKTTTLKMITGMLRPDSGTVEVGGFDIVTQPLEAKKVLGFVPDSGAVYESLTGMEYLLMVAALYGIDEAVAVGRISRFMDFFELDLPTLESKLLGAFSKGMRRKVVITSALLHNPKIVFLDEPLDGLDANAAVGFKALLETLAKEGKTIVYSSHILDVVERVCDRVAMMHKGRLIADGTPAELLASHGVKSLEAMFTQLTGQHDALQRAESFARDVLA